MQERLSIDHPLVRRIQEEEITSWATTWGEHKGLASQIHSYNCYQDSDNPIIPDSIEFNGEHYSPYDVLTHVKLRDKAGLSLLQKIFENQQENENWISVEKLKHMPYPLEDSMQAVLQVTAGYGIVKLYDGKLAMDIID